MTAVDVSSFLSNRRTYLTGELADTAIEFGAPRMHYESQDAWSSTVSCCLDWRAEIHLSALDALPQAPDVVAGFVDFLVVQPGEEPIPEVLELYGRTAAAFAELFEGAGIAPDLDEADDFADGIPISAALLILHAELDPQFAHHGPLRPWAVSQIAHTMLPTTAGVVIMSAFAPSAPGGSARRLVDASHLDRDWPTVGCTPIPRHPGFVGQATAYTYLDDARSALAAIRAQTFRAG